MAKRIESILDEMDALREAKINGRAGREHAYWEEYNEYVDEYEWR